MNTPSNPARSAHALSAPLPPANDLVAQIVWSTPSVFGVARSPVRAVVCVHDEREPSGFSLWGISKMGEGLKDLRASALARECHARIANDFLQVRAAMPAGLVIFAAHAPLKEEAVRQAVYRANGLPWRPFVPEPERETRDAERDRRRRRSNYPLDFALPFGKHRGLTIREIIDRHPGYIAWALENISPAFLAPDAAEHYAARRRGTHPRGTHRRGVRRPPDPAQE